MELKRGDVQPGEIIVYKSKNGKNEIHVRFVEDDNTMFKGIVTYSNNTDSWKVGFEGGSWPYYDDEYIITKKVSDFETTIVLTNILKGELDKLERKWS